MKGGATLSIVANFDINLRGNTGSIDSAADKTANKIQQLRQSVDNHGSAIQSRMAALAEKVKSGISSAASAIGLPAEAGKALGAVLDVAGGAWKALAGTVKGAVAAIGGDMMGMLQAAGDMKAGLKDILGNIVETVKNLGVAWWKMGLAAMGGITEAQKAANKLGMSVEAVQGFAFKSKLEIGELSSLLVKFEGHLGHGGGAGSPFARLGLDAARLKAARPEEALGMVADGFENIGNQADRVALAMDIFGKSGADALRLLQGGSKGIAESLAEARELGLIVGGNESRQVADASAALGKMKQAVAGLGKTAAVTIAPFVQMIANTVTDAMKWINKYRENIIDFAYGIEFAFKNFGDYVHLYFGKATLWITEFTNATVHVFTNVLPQLFHSFGEMLFNGITTGFAGGFDKAWDRVVADVKASMNRQSGELEATLWASLDAEEKGLQLRKNKFMEEKKAALNIGPPGQSTIGGASRDNAAVERGSAEAFKIIAGDQGDKMYKALNEQTAIQRKMLEELRKHGPRAAREVLERADL